MFNEFVRRLTVISRSPIDVYIAGNNSRYWYPYRLQHIGYASESIRDSCLTYILDSNINDEEVTNRELLDKADDLDVSYIVPKDFPNEQTATTNSVREFIDRYNSTNSSARPLIPLQPPYDEHYSELSDFTHYALGGISERQPTEQIDALRSFREVAGNGVYAHAMGLGVSLEVVKALRKQPRLIDSLDVSSPEQLVLNDTITDKTLTRIDCPMPHGENSTTVRAGFMQAVALQLNYLLSPLCSDEEITETGRDEADAMDW